MARWLRCRSDMHDMLPAAGKQMNGACNDGCPLLVPFRQDADEIVGVGIRPDRRQACDLIGTSE